jgi:hypothetical protein
MCGVGPLGLLAAIKPVGFVGRFALAGFGFMFGLRMGFFRGRKGSAGFGLRVYCGPPPLLGVGVGVRPFDMAEGESLMTKDLSKKRQPYCFKDALGRDDGQTKYEVCRT